MKYIPSRNKRKYKCNKTGVTGVMYRTEFTYPPREEFITTWIGMDWKQHTQGFSVSKLGFTTAFHKACEYRKTMIAKLNKQGAGYGPLHGL